MLVSVLMGVYNGERYVQAAVDSILAQTFTDFEFIIVDDGSTDGTAAYLDTLDDPRLRILRNGTRGGLTQSLNSALPRAQGAFIARQDADDSSLPERLARQVTFLQQRPDVGLVGTAVIEIDAAGQSRGVRTHETDNARLQANLLTTNRFFHGSVMYRRDALPPGGYAADFLTAQDYDLWLKIAETWNIANLAEPLYRYRVHTEAISQRKQAEQAQAAAIARQNALARRRRQAQEALRSRRGRSRRWWAERLTWWSIGSHAAGQRRAAATILLLAILFNPFHQPAWRFLVGVGQTRSGRWLGKRHLFAS